jgi:hypothetical protein
MKMRKDGYSDALILSEGRYERRERLSLREVEQEIMVEPVVKTLWIRTSNPMVVKRVRNKNLATA